MFFKPSTTNLYFLKDFKLPMANAKNRPGKVLNCPWKNSKNLIYHDIQTVSRKKKRTPPKTRI